MECQSGSCRSVSMSAPDITLASAALRSSRQSRSWAAASAAIPVDRLVKSIDELMQATVPGGFEIATKTAFRFPGSGGLGHGEHHASRGVSDHLNSVLRRVINSHDFDGLIRHAVHGHIRCARKQDLPSSGLASETAPRRPLFQLADGPYSLRMVGSR